MFAGKFDSIIPLDKEEQIEAIKKIRQILEEGKEHRYTNLEIVLLKTIEDQLKEIESLKNRTAKVQVKLQKIIDYINQWLQDNGYEDASKALDCVFEL